MHILESSTWTFRYRQQIVNEKKKVLEFQLQYKESENIITSLKEKVQQEKNQNIYQIGVNLGQIFENETPTSDSPVF